jgi:hypothetical protein
VARASGDIDLEFFAGFFAAIGATERGQIAEARQHLAALVGPVAASQKFYFAFLRDRLSVSLDILTGVSGVQDRIDELAARYEMAHAESSGTWALETGALALQSGRLGDLIPALAAMVDGSDIAGNWVAPYSLALLEAGDRAAAATVLDGFSAPPLDFFWLTTIQIMAQVAVGLGRQTEAAAFRQALLPFRDQVGITASGSLCLGLVVTTLGELALSLGDDDEATALLREAVERSNLLGAPFESVRAGRLLVQVLLRNGRNDEALDAVAAASSLAAIHGFDGEAAQLEALAKALARAPHD